MKRDEERRRDEMTPNTKANAPPAQRLDTFHILVDISPGDTDGHHDGQSK